MIIYRDTSPEHVPRTPTWLVGVGDLCRRDNLLMVGDPILLADPGPKAKWHDLEDYWQVTIRGEPEQHLLLRRQVCVSGAIQVQDAQARAWQAPLVLDGQGAPRMAMAMSKITGTWKRTPSEEQARLIDIATSIRSEILSQRFTQLDIGIIADWTADLLCAIYHLTPVVLGIGLMDDVLLARVCAVASGLPSNES